MRILASIVGVVIAVGFTVIAAVMNWRYGLSLGRSADDQLLFAAVGLGVDFTKIVMPFFCWWALSNRRWIAGTLAIIALVGCVGYSVAGIAGFADLARATTTGTLLVKKEQAEGLRKDLQRKQSLLDALGVVEPATVVEQKIEAQRQDLRWRTSRECAEATVATSRDFCRDYRRLEAEKERSLAFVTLEAEIASIRQQIGALAGVAEIDRGDPRAGILSRLTGWELLRVQTGLSLLFVGIVEFMSTFGIFIALNHGEVTRAIRRSSTGEVSAQKDVEPIDVESDVESLATPKPPRLIHDERPGENAAEIEQMAKFAVSCMQPKRGARILVASLYPRYCRWCAAANLVPMPTEAFILKFKELCVQFGFPHIGDGDMLVAEGFQTVA